MNKIELFIFYLFRIVNFYEVFKQVEFREVDILDDPLCRKIYKYKYIEIYFGLIYYNIREIYD